MQLMAQKQVVSNVRNQNFQLTANSVCFALLYLLIKKYSLFFSLKHTKHIYTHMHYFQNYDIVYTTRNAYYIQLLIK